MNNNSKIALIGSNGKAGSVILSTLLSQEYMVKALARDPNKLQLPLNKLLQLVIGDVTNSDVLANLLDGCSVIVNCVSNAGNPSPISSKVTSSIIKYVQNNHNIRYFVITGKTVKTPFDKFSLNTYLQRNYLLKKYPDIVRSKQDEYFLLSKSLINWTLIRCPFIIDGEEDNYKVSLIRCNGKAINKKSLAKFIIDEIENKKFIQKAPYLFN